MVGERAHGVGHVHGTVVHRIRIRMDPHWFGYLDPIHIEIKKPDPDPQHC